MNPTASNISSADPEIRRQYAEHQAAQQPIPVQGPRMVQGNRQQQDEVRNACRVKQIEQLAAIPLAEEGLGDFFILRPTLAGLRTGCERKRMIYDFAGELSRLYGSDSSGEADPDSGCEPDPQDDVSEAADPSSSAAESGGDDSSSDSGNRDVAPGRTDFRPLLFKQVVSSSRGREEYAEEFCASDEDSGDSLFAGDAGSGSEPVLEDEEDSGDASDQGSISSAGESDDESGCARSTDAPDNQSGGTGDSGTNENHLDEFNSSNQCLTLKSRRSHSKTPSDAQRYAGEQDAALAFAQNPQSSQHLTHSWQLRPWNSSRHARDARSDSENSFSNSEGSASLLPGVVPFFSKGSSSFGGQADSFDAQQPRFRLSENEESNACLGDERLSSVGYSETTEESSTYPKADLGPELRADILEDIAEANRKSEEKSGSRVIEYLKRPSRLFTGNGFSVSVGIPFFDDGGIFLEFKGKLEQKYLQPVAEEVQEKLVLRSSLTIFTEDQGGCASASEFIRFAPQSLLDSIPELKFLSDQDPALIPDAHSLGKLLSAIRAVSAPSSVVPILLKRCSEPMARLSKFDLILSGSYCPSTEEWLAQHSDLKELSIKRWDWNPSAALVAHAVEPLLLALERNTSVQRLSLSLSSDANKEAIISLLVKNVGIRQLNLQHFLKSQADAAIIQSLHLRPCLDKLEITVAGLDIWTALANLIASPSCPRQVEVEEYSSGGEFDTMRLISALAENRNLEVLDLKLLNFSRQAVPHFVKMVESHPTLKEIRISSTSKFSRDDVERIRRALERNRGISVAAPAATAALQVLAGRNYPPEISHQVIEQIRMLSPQGKKGVLQTLVNLRDAVLQPGPRS